MATTYFTRVAYKSGGTIAGARVQYITRTGPYQAPAEARVHHQGREAGTDLVREDLVSWQAQNLPGWSQEDPAQFFRTAEAHERAGGVAYTEWRFSLPRELTRDQQMDAARDVLQASFGTAHPYVWAFHDPPAADGGRQPHVHVLWSARTLDDHDRSPAQFFKRYNAAHPERGGARKDPELNHMGAVKAARVLYTDVMNMHLEQAGRVERLHPDTLLARGIDYRTGEPRLSIIDSNTHKYGGGRTERMQQVLDHRQERRQYTTKERVQARTYWEGRKATLGIDRAMAREEQLGHIREARAHLMSHAPERHSARELGEQVRTLDRHVQGLERHHLSVRSELSTERFYEQIGKARPPAGQALAEQVLARGHQHGLPRDRAAERVGATLERGRLVTKEVTRPVARGLAHSREDAMQQGVHWREQDYGLER